MASTCCRSGVAVSVAVALGAAVGGGNTHVGAAGRLSVVGTACRVAVCWPDFPAGAGPPGLFLPGPLPGCAPAGPLGPLTLRLGDFGLCQGSALPQPWFCGGLGFQLAPLLAAESQPEYTRLSAVVQ